MDTVQWHYFANTLEALEQLRQQQYKIIAIEQTENAVFLNEFIPENGEKIAVVFGHEVHGVDQKVVDCCDAVIEIPQLGTKHSLNIAVCAGIVAWDLFTKMST